MSDLETHIKPLIEAIHVAQEEFHRHLDVVKQHTEAIERFDRFAEASRQSADDENVTLRSLIRSLVAPKEALKLQARRNGHLEDEKNFLALRDEARRAKIACNIDLSMKASALMGAHDAVRRECIAYLQERLIECLPDEYFQLIALISEQASSGKSDFFNVDSTVHEPIEFALREVGSLIGSHVRTRRKLGEEVSKPFPDSPAGLRQYILGPAAMHKLKTELNDPGSISLRPAEMHELKAKLDSLG